MVDTKKLRAAMAAVGYNQSSLARAIGCTENTISAKVNNKTDMTIREAKRICEVLEIVEDQAKIAIFFA